jgi:hypothetical protein
MTSGRKPAWNHSNNGGLWGLQKREYLAKTEGQFLGEFVVDMVDKCKP